MSATFSRTAGWIFVILGLLGLFTEQLFGVIQFDVTLTFVHLILGVLGLAAVANHKEQLYAAVIGSLLLLLAIIGFFNPSLFGFHLEAVENLMHLGLGAWGVYAGVYKRK